MRECRHCREWLRGDPSKIGSRCPRCRQPLYDKPERERNLGDQEAPRCQTHPGRAALGPCPRCGSLMCGLCRTRWHDKHLCLACCDRARREPHVVDAGNQARQAGWSLVLGLGGWVLFILGAVALLLAQGGQPNRNLATLGVVTMLTSFLPTLFGLGQATAAIRTRGPRQRTATLGLVLGGAQLGIVIGFLLLSAWHL